MRISLQKIAMPVLALLLSFSMMAQVGSDGSILGVVSDPTGAVVS
ncbi:MAG: hypothetical protein WD696_09740 [Bryobacteraceae bacterium]